MFATFISSIIIVLTLGMEMCRGPLFGTLDRYNDYFEWFFVVCFFLSLLPWICMLFLSQGAETNPITIAGLRSNIDDRKMYLYSGSIVFVSLLGFITTPQPFFLPIWAFILKILCAGILLDLFRMSYCRLQFRRTPEGLIHWFSEVTKRSVQRRDETWHTICFQIPFTMMAFYMKQGAYGSLRLFCDAIGKMSSLWLGSIASFVAFRIPSEFDEGLLDRYTAAEIETVKRLRWLIQEACVSGSIPGLEDTLRLSGRLFVSFHNQHTSLGYLLLSMISQSPQKEYDKITTQDFDLEVIATCWYMIKLLIESSRDRRTSNSAVIRDILTILESKITNISQQERNIQVAYFMQPFGEIDRMLGQSHYQSLPERDTIIMNMHSVIARVSS